ncbi:uncharacterized protein METZ01_LOCUS82031, partial [marine metagenome]
VCCRHRCWRQSDLVAPLAKRAPFVGRDDSAGLQIAQLQLVSGPACGGALMIARVSDAVTDPETSATVPACTNPVLDPTN